MALQQRDRDGGDQRDGQKLCQKARRVPPQDHRAPRTGEPEAQAFERDPKAKPDGQHQAKAPARQYRDRHHGDQRGQHKAPAPQDPPQNGGGSGGIGQRAHQLPVTCRSRLPIRPGVLAISLSVFE